MDKRQLLEKLKAQEFSERIIQAFSKVDRSRFVLTTHFEQAYDDRALPIECSQTISQPSTIAFMLELLDVRLSESILEVGSGSGYVLALLAEINPQAEIFGTERFEELVQKSREKLSGFGNVEVIHSPKQLGLPDKAPFERILVSASAIELPKALVDQLNEGGVMVCPVNNSIIKAVKTLNGISTEEYFGFNFVKLHENDINP